MNNDTTLEHQQGYFKPAETRGPTAPSMPFDSDWFDCWKEFDRLRKSGLKPQEAVQVFSIFLQDPDPTRSASAQLLIDTFTPTATPTSKPTTESKAL